MSYDIYKSIKQNKDGSFDVVCAASNLFDRNDNYVFYDYHMTYWKDKFPMASNAELKALWLLRSTYVGDKFYPTVWKNGQKLANKFMMEKGYDEKEIYLDDDRYLKTAQEFIQWLKGVRSSEPIKNYVVMINGRYVYKRNPTNVKLVYDECFAKVFRARLGELKEKFIGYDNVHFFEK